MAQKILEEDKKWFIIIGILNKILSNSEVEQLYKSGRIKIYGPYTNEEIKKFYESKKIINENIIQKRGENTWKPLHSYDDTYIKSLLAKNIFIEKEQTNDNQNNISINVRENNKKRIRLSLAYFAVLILGLYYYYDTYYCDAKRFYKKYKNSVVIIYTKINNEIRGLGTGFFLKDSKLILTNLHVISKATDISIKSGDGRTYTPESVNFIDPKNDLALIKVNENSVPEGLTFGNPDKVEEGDKIFVIGNPAGWELTLSEGIVSGKRNIDPLSNEFREMIQITAPISPGSSGSPVFNKRGKIIGVATLGSANASIQNLNFAATIKPIKDYKKYSNRSYFKFLDKDTNWSYIDTITTSYIRNQNYFITQKEYISINLFYSPSTITIVNEDLRTAWISITGNRTTRFESNLFYNLYDDIHDKTVFYILTEVDCKKRAQKILSYFAYFNNQLIKAEDTFANDKWDITNEKFINEICK